MRVRDAMAAGLVVLLLLLLGAADARAAIGPGVVMMSEQMETCTSNFVFRDLTDLYLGFAAHCVEDLDAPSGAPGQCAFASLPPGSPVTIEGASRPGHLAYSSWHAMRELAEKDAGTCAENDFAIVRIDPADHAAVDPSVPVFGGPVGLRRAPLQPDETVISYGRSRMRGDTEPLRPREGYVWGTSASGWRHSVYFLTTGIWGDSGSAVLDGAGGAAGVLVTLEIEAPGGNGITDLAKALAYMHAHGGPDAHLVSGTQPFTGSSLPEQVSSPPSDPDPAPQPPPPPTPAPASAPPPAAATQPPRAVKPKPKPKAAKRKPARRCRTHGAKRRAAKKCPRRKRR